MNIKMIGTAVLAGAMIAGCGTKDGEEAKPAEKKADEVALSVNGEKLMSSQIDADVEAMIKAQGNKIPAEQQAYAKQMFRSQMAQRFLFEKVLVGKAKRTVMS